jgi:peptide/nickel transport system substrate-binding protein
MTGHSVLARAAVTLMVLALSACQTAAPTPPTNAPAPTTAPTSPTAAAAPAASPAVAGSPAAKPAASPAASPAAAPAASPAASPVASVVAAAASVSPTLTPAPPAGKRGGTLILARQGEATNLDPQKVPAFTSQRIFELVYSRLTSLTADLTVQPDLAESWTVSGDGKTYTFKLRQAKFHNGDPVTSGDVKFTFDRILTVDGSVAKSLFTDIDHVDTPDPQTVVFVLKQPNVTILPYMASPNASIVSQKVADANANDLSKKEAAIGSGPFKLTEWVPDNYMLLQANTDYFLPGLPYLDAVRINIVPDQAGLVAALRTKAADMAIIEDAQTAQSLRQEAGITLDARPSPNYNLLFINTTRKPFDNVKVRQAISYAIDRQQIIDTVALGEGEATGPIAPALTQYALPVSQYPSYTRDVAKAKQLLQEANVGPIEFTMLTETTEPVYAKDVAQIVQQQLADVGIKMNIELLEFTQWVQRWLKADFDMAPGLNGGNADPDYYIFRYFTTDGNLNFVTSYQNQTVSDAIKQARTTTDVARRKQLYQTVQTQLVDDAPFIWTFVPRDYMAYLDTTKDFVHVPTGNISYLRQTWLDK